jgi:hypothetical protein
MQDFLTGDGPFKTKLRHPALADLFFLSCRKSLWQESNRRKLPGHQNGWDRTTPITRQTKPLSLNCCAGRQTERGVREVALPHIGFAPPETRLRHPDLAGRFLLNGQ